MEKRRRPVSDAMYVDRMLGSGFESSAAGGDDFDKLIGLAFNDRLDPTKNSPPGGVIVGPYPWWVL